MLVFSAIFYIGSLVAIILLYVFFTTVSQHVQYSVYRIHNNNTHIHACNFYYVYEVLC